MQIIIEPSFYIERKKGFFKLASKARIDDKQKKIHFEIPAGFTTNFASIPRGFRWLIPINGRHRLPALVHDFLYSRKGNISGKKQYTRKEADQAFKRLMKTYKVKGWRIRLMYRAVRLFGGLHWGDE